MATKILVPYDFSPAADRALEWAAAQQRLAGGSIHVLHVVTPIPPAIGMGMAPVPLLPSEEVVSEARRQLEERVAKLGSNATAEVVLLPGTADVILGRAEREGIDLIVMGTHGRSGVSRLFLGSVAELVLRHAPCPVVTLRAPA